MKEDTRTKTNRTNRTYADDTVDTRSHHRRERGTAERDNPNLARLKDLKDYKVASDDPDVRGWSVISGDNENLGKVNELIVDTKRMKVRYLVVDIMDKYAADKNDHYMLVPVGAARLHEKDNDVIVSGITTRNSTNYPVYRGDSISRDYEHSIRKFYEAGGAVPTPSATESITEHETIRDAHTGTIYERQDRETSGRTQVDSNNRNRVDVVTGTSGDEHRSTITGTGSTATGDMSKLPQEDRMKDRDKMSSNTMRGDRAATDRRPDSNTTFGEFNTTQGSDIKDRINTSGISSSRTSNLPNKELRQGPSSASGKTSEEERVRIHDTDPNVQATKGERETGFNETSNLNRSTSLGNDAKRGSNMGNLENRTGNPGMHDRDRMSSPEFTDRTATPGGGRHPEKYEEGKSPVNKKDLEHTSDELPDDRYDPSTDEFYTHDHFDEDRFYGNRRKK